MSDKVVCEFCNNEFTNKVVLGTHQRRAKYCLEIQKQRSNNVVEELIECEYCIAKVDMYKIQRHYETCKAKLRHELTQKDELIEQLRQEVISLRAEVKLYMKYREEDRKDLHKLASRPTIIDKSVKKTKTTKTTNNVGNTTVVTSLNFDDSEYFKQKINEKYDKHYLNNGHNGVVQFATKFLLTDKDGDYMYVCTDKDNKVFMYKNHDGADTMDPKAEKLLGVIHKPIIDKAKNILEVNIMNVKSEEYSVLVDEFENIRFPHEPDYEGTTLVDKFADSLYQTSIVNSD